MWWINPVESFFIPPMETIPEENIEEINDVDIDIEISSDNEMEIEEWYECSNL